MLSNHRDRTAVQIRSPIFEPVTNFPPVCEGHQTQIGRGEYNVVSSVASARNVWMFHTKISPLSIAHIVPDPKFLLFLLPMSLSDEFRFNGHVATANTIYINTGFDGYTARGGRRDFISIAVTREQFVAVLSTLNGASPDELSLHDGAVELPPLVIYRTP